jgi:hypothetical protein
MLSLYRHAASGRAAARTDRMRETGFVTGTRRFNKGERNHFISLEMASIGMEMSCCPTPAAQLSRTGRNLIIALATRFELVAIPPLPLLPSPGGLRTRIDRSLPSRGRVGRPHSQGREAGRSTGPTGPQCRPVINMKTANPWSNHPAAYGDYMSGATVKPDFCTRFFLAFVTSFV